MPLTLAEQVERIERRNDETHQLVSEARRLAAEQGMPQPASRTPERDQLLAPVLLLIFIVAGCAACFAAGAAFARTWGAP